MIISSDIIDLHNFSTKINILFSIKINKTIFGVAYKIIKRFFYTIKIFERNIFEIYKTVLNIMKTIYFR